MYKITNKEKVKNTVIVSTEKHFRNCNEWINHYYKLGGNCTCINSSLSIYTFNAFRVNR